MVTIKMQIGPESGRYEAVGHCKPDICCAVCTLEDALEANLRVHGAEVDGENEYGEREIAWAGANTKVLAEFAAVAFTELAESYPDEVSVEVQK